MKTLKELMKRGFKRNQFVAMCGRSKMNERNLRISMFGFFENKQMLVQTKNGWMRG